MRGRHPYFNWNVFHVFVLPISVLPSKTLIGHLTVARTSNHISSKNTTWCTILLDFRAFDVIASVAFSVGLQVIWRHISPSYPDTVCLEIQSCRILCAGDTESFCRPQSCSRRCSLRHHRIHAHVQSSKSPS